MKNKKISLIIFILIIITGFISYNFINKKGDYSITNYYLDTVNEITLINVRKSKADNILPNVNKLILDINNKMSMQLPDSELNKINKNAGIKPVTVSKDTLTVIKKAVYYSKLVGSTFDITVGPLTSLWNIGNESAKIPKIDEIKNRLPLINFKNIIINEKNSTVYLKNKGMKIDLGGIAKGFCADKVANYLRENDVKNAIINLGGNIFVIGKNKKNQDFTVGIQDPSENKTEAMGSITGSNISVVTSGIYERFIKDKNKVYHHMLNPVDGYPFQNNLNSVTIISSKSIDGDALSTSLFGLGLENGLKKAESLPNIEAIFITKSGKVYTTNGIKNNFKIITKKYTLVK